MSTNGTRPEKPTPGWAQGCAASLVLMVAVTALLAAGVFVGWLIWG